MCPVLAFIDNPVMMLLLAAIAVMLFGERLPEVARTFGKTLMEFKSGMRGIQDEIQSAINSAGSVESPSRYQEPDDRDEATAPKFEPPPSP
jgi:sec-independent protein translocase protein TatA